MGGHRIIVGVDGSSGGQTALEWAVDECEYRACTLLIVHTLGSRHLHPAATARAIENYSAYAEHLLVGCAMAASTRQPGVVVTTLLGHDLPADTLIALSVGAELVVVGAEGTNAFINATLGTVARRTAAHAHCPVAVIPPRLGQSSTDREQPILVVQSGDHAGRLALEFARHEADVRGVALQTLHIGSQSVGALRHATHDARVLVLGCSHNDDEFGADLGQTATSLLPGSLCPVILVGTQSGPGSVPNGRPVSEQAATPLAPPTGSRPAGSRHRPENASTRL
ncbi:MAG: universal stress protein [Jatrophihabitantaceae bacterium]